MKLNVIIDKLNDTNECVITKGTLFGENTYMWRALSKNYKKGDALNPKNSSIGMILVEKDIVNMAKNKWGINE